MSRSTYLRRRCVISFVAALMAFLTTSLTAQSIGYIEVKSVSPRDVAEVPDDEFDEVSSGLNVVGVEEKVYLEAKANPGEVLGGAAWALTGAPTGSSVVLSDTEGTLITLRPDVAGLYLISMTPLDASMVAGDPVEIRLYAGIWVGAGVFNTHGEPDSTIPHCGNSCCHAESTTPRLNVVNQWLQTNHANTLQLHLNGERGDHLNQSCLPCHTLGFNEMAMNNGFDDIALEIDFDLSLIEQLVDDAVANGNDNFPQLPAMLQGHASVQCESCHGPGSQHLGFLLEEDHGIAGVDLNLDQCAQCHDSASGFQQGFYQWGASSHPVTQEAAGGYVAGSDSCRVCHTGEGFVHGLVEGGDIPQKAPHEYVGITCSSCHDPHGSEYPHQLRLIGDTTLPSGDVYANAGKGGLCMNCHNSRSSDGNATATGSFRGAHHGPQADMLLGVNMADFGLEVIGNSAHTTIVDDTCVACHMVEGVGGGPGQTEPPLVGEHTFALRDVQNPADPNDDIINAENACASCHPGLTETYDREARGDYDGDGMVEGIQAEVDGLLALLRPGLLALPSASLGGDGTIGVDGGAWAGWTEDQQRARYNYNFVIDDGSYGIHNTSYAIQALQRAYFGAYGRSILNDYPDIDLRGPVQPSTVVTPTPTLTPVPTVTPEPTPIPEYLAVIDILGVSPRTVAGDTTGVFDERSSGLNAVGIGEKVYMEAVAEDDSVIGYTWSILQAPSGSAAALSATSGGMVTFRPDVRGTYIVRLTPRTNGKQVIDVYDQRLYAARWVGAGVFDTHGGSDPRAPQCGTSFCHGDGTGNPKLNVLDDWLETGHATKLQRDLNGETTGHYEVYCLPCHSVGFNQHPEAVNNGFDDIAADLNFDLNQIPGLVADAYENNNQNFDVLPGELQDHASIQCESCHGAGSLHPANLSASDKGISGANLDVGQCGQCHDSASGFQEGFYQWNTSSHPVSAEGAGGHVAESDSCRVCHTGEGFVYGVAEGGEIPQLAKEEYHGITCSSCHDPHSVENEAQLRVAGDYQLPSGVMSYGAGRGGMCYRCHNSRVSDAEATATGSFRAAHHGPQADMLLGTAGNSFGLGFAANSPHAVVVEDSCVSCHMAEGIGAGPGQTDRPLVGEHTFSLRDVQNPEDPNDDIINPEHACASCHIGLDTYDYAAYGDFDGDGSVEGTQTEVRGLLELLRPGLLALPSATLAPDGTIGVDSGAWAGWTDNQKRARYNYNFVVDDGSYGVHNTAYTVQLLQRAYYGVYGVPITADYPSISLRGPVQTAAAKEFWLIQ